MWVRERRWTFAKTYADTAPHEYIVRDRLPEREIPMFENFVWYIHEAGYTDTFGGKEFTYLELDGYKYWTMGSPVPDTKIINREPLDGYEETPTTANHSLEHFEL